MKIVNTTALTKPPPEVRCFDELKIIVKSLMQKQLLEDEVNQHLQQGWKIKSTEAINRKSDILLIIFLLRCKYK